MIQARPRRPTGFLQCFDTVGLVIWPVKIVPEMTYYVLSGTLNPTHSFTDDYIVCYVLVSASWQVKCDSVKCVCSNLLLS